MSRDQSDKKKLIQCLSKSGIVQAACQKTGVSRATYYRWYETDSKFAADCDKAIRRGKDVGNDVAESQLRRLINEGNLQAIMYWLNNNHPNYAYPNKLVRKMFDEVRVLIAERSQYDNMSDEELTEKIKQQTRELRKTIPDPFD